MFRVRIDVRIKENRSRQVFAVLERALSSSSYFKQSNRNKSERC